MNLPDEAKVVLTVIYCLTNGTPGVLITLDKVCEEINKYNLMNGHEVNKAAFEKYEKIVKTKVQLQKS